VKGDYNSDQTLIKQFRDPNPKTKPAKILHPPAGTTVVGYIFCMGASMGAVEVDSRSPGPGLHDPVARFTILGFLFLLSLSHRRVLIVTTFNRSGLSSFVCLFSSYHIILGDQNMMASIFCFIFMITPRLL
jgi:hypothetical protein